MQEQEKNKYESILPNDEDLIKRNILWGTILEKYDNNEEFEHIPFKYTRVSNDESSESIEPVDFEIYENDSDFDVQDVLNKTKKCVERRKENWHTSGLDQIMDSFNLTKIQDKVGTWLFNENNLFLDYSISKPTQLSLFNQKVEIQKQKFYSNNDSDSVDTARYILSSRKRLKNKVTTMTIKRYCYSNRRRIIETELNSRHSDDYRTPMKAILRHKSISPKQVESCNTCKSRRKKPNKEIFKANNSNVNNTYNSTSVSTDADSGYEKNAAKLIKSTSGNLRKISRKSLKTRNILHAKENNNSSSISEKSIPNRRKKYFKKPLKNTNIQNSNINIHVNEMSITEPSEIYFNENNIINSTAINKSKIINDPIKLPLSENSDILKKYNTCKNSKSETNLKKNIPIVLYEPNKSEVDPTTGKFVLTKEILLDKIGEHSTDKILQGEKEIQRKFNHNSKIIFYPSENEIHSSNSDSDFLENGIKNLRRLVEIVNHK